jgi:hypothetical protein
VHQKEADAVRESGQVVAAAGTADAAFHDNSAPDLGRPTAASPFAETKRVTQGDMKITPK